MRPSPQVITVLQAGRALAALVVVLHHAGASTVHFSGSLGSLATAVLLRGYLGVDFFFVLSGFIIYYTNTGKTKEPGWSRRYAETRLVRIFVPYLPVGIAVALGYTFLPGLSADTRDWGWFTTLTLLPSNDQPALIVAWTLRHELIFYGVFWLAFLFRRPVAILGLWLVTMIAASMIAGDLDAFSFTMIGSLNIEFLFGMAVVHLLRKPVPDILFVAAGVSLFILYLALGALEVHRILFAGSLALLLVPIVRWEQSQRLRAPNLLVLLGNASYSIYLVHNPLMALLVRLPLPSPALTLLYLTVAGTGAGLLYHLIVEKPGIALVRAWLRIRRNHPVTATPAS